MSAGKGSKNRTKDFNKFRSNWDSIFKDKVKDNAKQATFKLK